MNDELIGEKILTELEDGFTTMSLCDYLEEHVVDVEYVVNDDGNFCHCILYLVRESRLEVWIDSKSNSLFQSDEYGILRWNLPKDFDSIIEDVYGELYNNG